MRRERWLAVSDQTASVSELYRPLDEAELGRKHWLTVFTAGMGFFTDAYDLFIIGTVTVLLTPIFHLSTNQISLLNSASLLASVAGALTFGKLMDHLGRKRMYGVEVAILVAGAIVNGHRDLPTGGHENSPRTASAIPQGRPQEVPADGHGFFPRTATGTPRGRSSV